MVKTMREQFVEALIKRGEKQVVSRSGKYLTFTRAMGGYYFIGVSGALRFGKSSSNSIPVSDAFKLLLLKPLPDEKSPK